MPEVRKERTDWRDSGLDVIHNYYEFACPADNVEFLMLEYDQGRPVALVDYRLKGRCACPRSEAVEKLCSNRNPQIPYIITEYEIENNEMKHINVICCNQCAESVIGNLEDLTEGEYIRLMYRLREPIVAGRTQQGINLSNRLNPHIDDLTERWNGEILSHRHRDWEWDCPVVDVDFIVINNGEPKAIVEYKNKRSFATPSKFKFHPTGKALGLLADAMMPKIPFLFVYYNDDFSDFAIYPLNYGWDRYEDYFGVHLNRDQYFEFLRKL